MPASTKFVPITVRLPADVHAALKAEWGRRMGAKPKTKLREVVIDALKAYLPSEPAGKVRR